MADYASWIQDLSKQTGASVEQSDIDRLNNTNPDDVGRLQDALAAQYQRRGASGQTGSGQDSSVLSAQGYGSARSETADDPRSSSSSGSSSLPSYTSGSGSAGAPDYASQLIQQMMERQAAQDAANKARGDALYSQLQGRANEALAIDRNDPIIRAQADAYSAQQDRARRNFISDAAERGGPLANLEGERRISAEHAGQATGAFEAQLMGQELAARRTEIQNALNGMAGLLTADQSNELQRQLGLLNQAIEQQKIGLGQNTLSQEWQRALLSNEQFNNQLGATAQQQNAYYDWLWGHGG